MFAGRSESQGFQVYCSVQQEHNDLQAKQCFKSSNPFIHSKMLLKIAQYRFKCHGCCTVKFSPEHIKNGAEKIDVQGPTTSLCSVHLCWGEGCSLNIFSLCVHATFITSEVMDTWLGTLLFSFYTNISIFHSFPSYHFTPPEFTLCCAISCLDFPYFLCFITNNTSRKILVNLNFICF